MTFTPLDDTQTLVTLVHSGWEHYADAVAAREEYRGGWPTVLAGFGADVGEAGAAPRGELWFVLVHTPGPAAADGGVFAHPLFGEHRAFLAALAADGVLVAAGPLPDEPGAGQAVIRVPAASAADYLARAEADPSVVADLLQLRVRPWRVILP